MKSKTFCWALAFVLVALLGGCASDPDCAGTHTFVVTFDAGDCQDPGTQTSSLTQAILVEHASQGYQATMYQLIGTSRRASVVGAIRAEGDGCRVTGTVSTETETDEIDILLAHGGEVSGTGHVTAELTDGSVTWTCMQDVTFGGAAP